MHPERLYRDLLRIRRAEQRILHAFDQGLLHGTTHACIGQEANAVAIAAALQPRDLTFSHHRNHGHLLAIGLPPTDLFAELLGRQTGTSAGRGGSQHLRTHQALTHGILGGTAPLAVGAALAEVRRGSGAIAAAWIGDGTLGQGVLYEAWNLASLWRAPVLFILEHNQWAQSTPTPLQLAGDPLHRARAFGLLTDALDSSDTLEIHRAADALIHRVRDEQRPALLLLHTWRLCDHSRRDDLRPPEDRAAGARRDPLPLHRARLPEPAAADIEADIDAELDDAFQRALHAPHAHTLPPDPTRLPHNPFPAAPPPPTGATVRDALHSGLQRALDHDPDVLLLGEDLAAPYGGAFGVTADLSTQHPTRVLNTPISEPGFVGAAVGMALRGLKPIVEIMFGDFLWLAADQLLNHAATLAALHPDHPLHLTVRTPMGGRRGYGPTHSQSLEARFLGAPGLRVVAPSALHDPADLLLRAVHSPCPTLFIESKRLYSRPLHPTASGYVRGLHAATLDGPWPTVRLQADPRRADLTLVAYGDMAEEALQAALSLLLEREVCADLLVPSTLSQTPLEPILASLRRSGRLLVCEEGRPEAGWGAELITRVAEHDPSLLRRPPRRVAATHHPTFAAPALERAILPDADAIARAALELLA